MAAKKKDYLLIDFLFSGHSLTKVFLNWRVVSNVCQRSPIEIHVAGIWAIPNACDMNFNGASLSPKYFIIQEKFNIMQIIFLKVVNIN